MTEDEMAWYFLVLPIIIITVVAGLLVFYGILRDKYFKKKYSKYYEEFELMYSKYLDYWEFISTYDFPLEEEENQLRDELVRSTEPERKIKEHRIEDLKIKRAAIKKTSLILLQQLIDQAEIAESELNQIKNKAMREQNRADLQYYLDKKKLLTKE